MDRIAAFLAILLLFPGAAMGQDNAGSTFRIGNDAYIAGARVSHMAQGIDDLFIAGETVDLAAPITGTAHMAARRVNVSQAVGQNLYAAGMDISISAPVEGNATLAGYSIALRGEIGGRLRASGANLTVAAPVGGTALLTGDRVELTAPVGGDVVMTAREIVFGDDASIGGTLHIYSTNPDDISIPATVIAENRITRHQIERWESPAPSTDFLPSRRGVLRGFFVGVVIVGAIAALIAAIAPGPMGNMRRRLASRPFAMLGWGFLSLSALVGSTIVIGLTLVGLLVAPALAVLALVAGFAGYVVGAYSFGAGILLLLRTQPDSLGLRILAAFAGVLVAALIALVPFVGWLFVLALTLAGLGALILNLFRPSFYAEQPIG